MEPYVASSYSWGNGKRFVNNKTEFGATAASHSTSRVAKDIFDAIHVAHALGFSFLWIDALCILQDCDSELKDQIQQMGEIYMGSSLTIFAVSSFNSDDGLDFQRDGQARKPSKIELRAEMNGLVFQIAGLLFSFRFDIAHLLEKIRKAPLFMRGWVFQEKLLAPRALLFARSEISWKCLCERSYEISPSCKANDLNLPTFESSYDDIVDRLRFDLYSKTSCLRSIFQGCYEMVEAYSERQLTYRSDVVPAISGIVLYL
jgi:hypothetical protein